MKQTQIKKIEVECSDGASLSVRRVEGCISISYWTNNPGEDIDDTVVMRDNAVQHLRNCLQMFLKNERLENDVDTSLRPLDDVNFPTQP